MKFFARAGAFLLATAGGLCAFYPSAATAKEETYPPQDNIVYYSMTEPENPAFQIALKGMSDIYKKDGWHFLEGKWTKYPIISVGTYDLNDDGKEDEIISFPEDYHYGDYCSSEKQVCPYYILEKRGDEIHNLGTIRSKGIFRDHKKENGYWKLRVYEQDPQMYPSKYLMYKYDPEQDLYVPEKTKKKSDKPDT